MSSNQQARERWRTHAGTFVVSYEGRAIARFSESHPDAEKNAQLAAAAPAMRDALEQALGCLKPHLIDCRRAGLVLSEASALSAIEAVEAALREAASQ